MKHEKTIRREDGSRVKIMVSVFLDSYNSSEPRYDFETSKCEKGKRTFIYPHLTDDYKWRSLNMSDRRKYQQEKYLQNATKEEVQNVMNELWEKMKPEIK